MFKFSEKKQRSTRANRREEIAVCLELSYAQAQDYQLELDLLLSDQPDERDQLVSGDSLRVNWKFHAQYLDNIDKQIEAVLRLIAIPGLIKSVNVQELLHGRSLIMELSDKLSRLIEKLEA